MEWEFVFAVLDCGYQSNRLGCWTHCIVASMAISAAVLLGTGDYLNIFQLVVNAASMDLGKELADDVANEEGSGAHGSDLVCRWELLG